MIELLIITRRLTLVSSRVVQAVDHGGVVQQLVEVVHQHHAAPPPGRGPAEDDFLI